MLNAQTHQFVGSEASPEAEQHECAIADVAQCGGTVVLRLSGLSGRL